MPGFECFGEAERKEVMDVLDTGVLMRYGFDAQRKGIWKAREMEEALAHRIQVPHAQLVSSGTAALTLALSALGVGAGDEVILPTFTFVASMEAVISVGAVPVFADVDHSLTLNPESVASAISDRTRVIMPVHMCGSMARMNEILELAERHGLMVLEDACQALGGQYRGRPLGSLGHAGCFSFDFVKLITCGEGGAVVTSSEDIYRRLEQGSDHGHDHLGVDRGADQHPILGYNFRISELNAAVGLAQIRRLDEFLEIQKRNHRLIQEKLEAVPGLRFRDIPDPEGDSRSFLSFFLPTENLARKAASALAAEGLGGNFYWYDNHWHYIGRWQHLQNGNFMYPLSAELRKNIMQQSNRAFASSDAVMSTCLSSAISLAWTEEEARTRGESMARVLQSVMEGSMKRV